MADLSSYKVIWGEAVASAKFDNFVQATQDAINAPVVVATTVAGLGTAVDGRIGRIRIGAETVDLVYVAGAGKWFSAPIYWPIVIGTAGYSTTSAAYVLLTGALVGAPLVIPNYKAMYDAGLRPQLAVMGTMRASAATLGSLELLIVDAADGDTAAGATVGTVDPIATVSANAITLKVGGTYTDPTGLASPASKAHAVVLPFAKVVSASTLFIGEQITNGPSGLIGRFRWVA